MSRNCISITSALLSTVLILLAAQQACAIEPSCDDKTIAPYFFVPGGDSGTDRLPLKATKVAVNISGVIADVQLTQLYRNEGQRPLEATYIFPGSTGAAVYAMTMTIGERRITAKIKEKVEARATYEKARAEGKTASLLEQQRPNVFQTSVANIMPGDEVAVELHYTELLTPTARVYQFVFPAVVGPRYTNREESTASADDRWVQNPYLREGEESPAAFDLTVHLDGGMPLQEVRSPSHEITVNFDHQTKADVRFRTESAENGNRDFILEYRLAGGELQSGLLLYKGEKENFFVAMLEPPFRPAVEQIPPRDYVFVVDVSGSMFGFPLDTSKELLRNLIGKLRPTDTFNVLLFSGGNSVLSETPLPATAINIDRAIDLISAQQGGGGTELLPALKRALALPQGENRARSIIIATDGFVDVETEAFDLVRNNLDRANVFAFGIGSSVNRFLIEGLAHVGLGEPFIVTQPREAQHIAAQLESYVSSPLLTQTKVQFAGFEAYDVEPATVPDVLADRPVAVIGKWRGEAAKGSVLLTGVTGKGRYTKQLFFEDYKPDQRNAALQYLWARERIRTLGDYNLLRPSDERKREITSLGLTYSLLTQYTSFVAVDEIVRRKTDQPLDSVKQPLPLPQGVSNLAVGGEVPTAPEPETWALMFVGLAAATWTAVRGGGRSQRSRSVS